MTTDYRYTGQREETEIGLYYYNARWYDPALGRFISADTVTSGSGGMAWERYAYVRDNPMRFTDPTGYDVGCPGKDASECGEGSELTFNTGNENSEDSDHHGRRHTNQAAVLLMYVLDRWLWWNVPSAIGFNAGFNWQVGNSVEAGFIPREWDLLFNWRYGQLTLTQSKGGYVSWGTPSVLGGSGYFGLTRVFGISDNGYLAGTTVGAGFAGAADAFGKAGLATTASFAMAAGDLDPLASRFIDPGSGQGVTYDQVDVTLGGNIAGNGMDLAVLAPVLYETKSEEQGGFLFNLVFPWWPLRR